MKAIVFLFLFALATSEEIVGGWVKRDFRENDMYIDRSRKLAEQQYYTDSNTDNSQVSVVPIAVYSQLVNGINYQIVQAERNRATNALTLHSYVIYKGPMGTNRPTLTVSRSQELKKGKPLLFAAAEYTDIHKAVSAYYSNANSMNHISSVVNYESPITDLKIFVVKAQVGDEAELKTCVLLEENGQLKQVAEIHNN